MWHKGTGRIVYDPFRGKMKRRRDWWAVIEVDREITRYYRWWIESELHIHSLVQPAWDAHISIIRGEQPDKDLMHLWKKYHGQTVEFEYEHNPRLSKREDYWTVTVKCPIVQQIRKELRRPFNWPPHLSVGKENY